jgi:DNA-binding NarL/FixJ family response regulator
MNTINEDSKDISIAFIEDDLKYRNILMAIFDYESGFKNVVGCESAENFFTFCVENKPHIDIILLDLELKGMNGVDAIDIIKKKLPSTKILVLTHFDNDEIIFNAMTKGADGYLLKSLSLPNLIESVKNMHHGITAMSPYIASRILEMFKNLTQPRKEYNLTNQEKKVLKEMVSGLSKKMVADKLFISYHTVDSHLRKIYYKLNVNSQVALVSKTIRERLI